MPTFNSNARTMLGDLLTVGGGAALAGNSPVTFTNDITVGGGARP